MDLWLLLALSLSRSAATFGGRLVSSGPQGDVHLPMLIVGQLGEEPLWRNDATSWEESVTARNAVFRDGD